MAARWNAARRKATAVVRQDALPAFTNRATAKIFLPSVNGNLPATRIVPLRNSQRILFHLWPTSKLSRSFIPTKRRKPIFTEAELSSRNIYGSKNPLRERLRFSPKVTFRYWNIDRLGRRCKDQRLVTGFRLHAWSQHIITLIILLWLLFGAAPSRRL